MQDYVRSGISILNDTTKDLKDLNQLGVYLSRQTDINALKTLKLLILASEIKRLNKPFDIKYINTYTECLDKLTSHKQKENISGNLSMNPQNFALELFEYIIKNYPVNLDFECYGMYTIFDNWTRSLRRMDYDDMDFFYKRYDMIDKKLDIIDFMIENGLLTKKQLNELIYTYTTCVDNNNNNNNFTAEQKQRMKSKIEQLIQFDKLHKHISATKNLSKEKREKEHDIIDKITGISRNINYEIYSNCRTNAEEEIQNYKMQNDQCHYMLNEIPRLIKHKIIK